MYEKSYQYYDAIYSFKNYEKEAETIHQLISQHKKTAGSTLLDVACGTGAHLVFLKKFYTIEGLDINPDMLKIARQKHPEMIFHLADMVDFDLGRKFDAIICLFSSIGYALTKTRLDKAVRNMALHLQQGGVLIVEPSLTPEKFTSGRVHGLWVDRPELKIARMNTTTVTGNRSRMDMHHLVGTLDGIEYFVEHHEMGLFTDEEYRFAFHTAGLEVIHDPEGLLGRGLYIATS